LDIKKILEKEENDEKKEKAVDTGKFETIIAIKVANAGNHNFKIVFADNFGFSTN